MSEIETQPGDAFTADGVSMELAICYVCSDVINAYTKAFGEMPEVLEYTKDTYDDPSLKYYVSVMSRSRLSQIFPNLYNNPEFRNKLDAVRLSRWHENQLDKVFITQRDFLKVVMILEKDSSIQVEG